MFTKALRISLFASILLLFSMGLYGQFSSKLQHQTLTNSVLQSDSDKQFFENGITGSDESMDIADIDDDDDGSFSVRKKNSFEGTAYLDLTQYSFSHFCGNTYSKYHYRKHGEGRGTGPGAERGERGGGGHRASGVE